MNNLEIYNKVRTVPTEAQKTITGGRLNGKTDINPMWRIKALTENFGACGFGWKTSIKRFWIEEGNGGEKSAFCEIELFVKQDGAWSDGISGIGGSALVAKEKSGLYTSDECFKMAFTDAISVACKMLGMGADIYWSNDKTKYDKPQEKTAITHYGCETCGKPFEAFDYKGSHYTAVQAYDLAVQKRGHAICKDCFEKTEEVKQELPWEKE